MAQFTLKLGDKSWTLDSPLKFKQLRLIEPAMTRIIAMKISGEGTTEKFYDEMANVILAAIDGVDTQFSRGLLDEMPVNVDDLSSGVKLIAQAAGLWKEPKPGEAQPAAMSAQETQSPSNGALSTQSLDTP